MLESMKTMAKFLCPRCLIVKADVPHIGKDFDTNRRKSLARTYSPKDVEIAREAIFDLGRSVGYKGELDPLKEGSWAPTRVRSPLVSVLRSVDQQNPRRMRTQLSLVSTHLC